eukprot:c13422_g1_i1.p1 GENE.c13422_g1_i1~~c13422_g1_i1.p1  ORF type:complete len:487 (+),score=112.62 c13422_g1_i1:107-1462(+)
MSLNLLAQAEHESVAHDTSLHSFLTLASVVAPGAPNTTEQQHTAVDIVAVLDRSGSMAGEKMKMLHRTVELLIQHLKECDRLSIVAYDDVVQTPLAMTNMDENGKAKARQALREVKERGGTDLCSGLLGGLNVLATRTTKNEVSSVLLMTDGLANEGITDKSQIIAQTIAKIQSLKNPVTVYTFGFGSDHDASLLADIATAGSGSYYFMKTPDSIPQAFADCVGGLMSVVAQNIEMTVTAAPGISIQDVLTNFPKTVVTPNQKFTIRIGDIFSEERKDFLVELTLPAVQGPTDAQALINVELSYFEIASVSTLRATATATVRRTAKNTPPGASSLMIDQHRNRIRTARAMDEAMRLGDQGQINEARSLLEKVRSDVGVSPSSALPECQALLADLTSVAENMNSRREYEAVAHKKLNVKSQKHWHQRATECDAGEVDAYTTNAKTNLKSAWK